MIYGAHYPNSQNWFKARVEWGGRMKKPITTQKQCT